MKQVIDALFLKLNQNVTTDCHWIYKLCVIAAFPTGILEAFSGRKNKTTSAITCNLEHEFEKSFPVQNNRMKMTIFRLINHTRQKGRRLG